MAIALVQVKTATGTSGSPNLTLTSASAAGNLLVAMLDTGQNSGNPTFSPPAGWTALTELTNQTFLFRNGQLFYYTNNPGGISSVAFTATPAISGGWCLYVFEFSGVATVAPLDQEAQHVNLSGQGSATPSETITTTAAGDLVLGWAAGDAANGASSVTGPASPWVNQAVIADAGGFERAIASYQVQTAAGAITYQPTFAATTDYIIAIASFKAAGGGSSVNGGGALIANSALVETAAQITNPSALVQANSALVETAAQIVNASAPLAANSVLAETGAKIIVSSAPMVSNSVLAIATLSVPGSVALTDTLAHVVTLSDTLVATATIADAAVALVSISDSPAEVG